jgi:hypothetical protein
MNELIQNSIVAILIPSRHKAAKKLKKKPNIQKMLILK